MADLSAMLPEDLLFYEIRNCCSFGIFFVRYYGILQEIKDMNTLRLIKDKAVLFIRSMRIGSRLIILFLVSFLLPILLCCLVLFQQSSATMFDNINKMISTVNGQTAVYLGSKMQKIISDGVEISYSDIIQKVLNNFDEYDPVALHAAQSVFHKDMNKKFVYNDMVTEISIYTTDLQKATMYGPYAYRFHPTAEELEYIVKKCEESERSGVLVSVNASNSIILCRQIKDKKSWEPIGYLVMRVDENRVSEVFEDTLTKINARSFIVDQDGVIVSSKNTGELSKKIENEDFLQKLQTLQGEQEGTFSVTWDGRKQIVNYAQITGTDWKIVTIVPESFFRVDSKQLYIKLLITVSVCILFSIVISLAVAISILSPVNHIIHAMKDYEDENSNIIIQDVGNDELTFMSHTFNQMILRLNQMIADIRVYEVQKRKLEIQTLQAQINPHFIANTLNMISSMAAAKNETGIENISNCLVDLLRDCIQTDERFVTVEDEISMLQSYINIQDYRMFGKFTVQMQIDPQILPCMTPHLVLQPIVENSIIHGILSLKSKRGQISIKGYREGEMLCFSVTDNGKGMTEEEIKNVLFEEKNNQETGRFNSIGVSNINKRLQLLFGSEYGLQISSSVNLYTTVLVRMPVIWPDSEECNHV